MKDLGDFLGVLTGFFIAGLAAVATFDNENIDKEVSGKEPLRLKNPDGRDEILTRRRFVCLLFGYLAFSSMMLYVLALFSKVFHYSIAPHVPTGVGILIYKSATSIGLFVFMMWFAHMMITALIGLYYLVDRLHRQEPKKIVSDTNTVHLVASDELGRPSRRKRTPTRSELNKEQETPEQ